MFDVFDSILTIVFFRRTHSIITFTNNILYYDTFYRTIFTNKAYDGSCNRHFYHISLLIYYININRRHYLSHIEADDGDMILYRFYYNVLAVAHILFFKNDHFTICRLVSDIYVYILT